MFLLNINNQHDSTGTETQKGFLNKLIWAVCLQRMLFWLFKWFWVLNSALKVKSQGLFFFVILCVLTKQDWCWGAGVKCDVTQQLCKYTLHPGSCCQIYFEDAFEPCPRSAEKSRVWRRRRCYFRSPKSPFPFSRRFLLHLTSSQRLRHISSSVLWNHCQATHSKMIACLSSPFISCVADVLALESVQRCWRQRGTNVFGSVEGGTWKVQKSTSKSTLSSSGGVKWLRLNKWWHSEPRWRFSVCFTPHRLNCDSLQLGCSAPPQHFFCPDVNMLTQTYVRQWMLL